MKECKQFLTLERLQKDFSPVDLAKKLIVFVWIGRDVCNFVGYTIQLFQEVVLNYSVNFLLPDTLT